MAAIAIVLAAGGVGGAFLIASGKEDPGRSDGRTHALGHSQTASREARLQVVTPVRGGMERTTSQPGTIRAFEFAELYSKVSGFVEELNVDRGSPVKKGQLLAEIYDPERHVAVLQAEAGLEHSKASVLQAQAGVLTAEADVQVALAKQKEAKAILRKAEAERDWRKIEHGRISDLVARKSTEKRLEDEDYAQYLTTEASVASAQAGIETAAGEIARSKAKEKQARADLKTAEAEVLVAEANLKMAKVFVQYTRIESPYDGVVTFRGESVHKGSFVRAATEGAGSPLLIVAETARMRTIVPVPDRDVPYCHVGDPATVQLDALAGRIFKGQISRVAESEDLKDRTMRVEIDLDNPDGVLRDGMFGRALILLEKLIKNLTVPSSCLIDRNGKGEGAVLTVKNGKVHRVSVHVGMDTGLRAEIIDGLADDDQLILQPDASIADGTPVQIESVSISSGESSPKAGP
ncbi:MAG: efflux RND transporter periplasmic adaptor subunit [Isosphaerales bacterium]